MKSIKTILLPILCCAISSAFASPSSPISFKYWVPYGNKHFASSASEIAFTTHSAGNAYAAYTANNTLSVMMLKNNTWVPAGTTDFTNIDPFSQISLVMNTTNPKSNPYVSYVSGENCSFSACQVVVKHYNGKIWKTVGADTLPSLSTSAALTIDSHGTPYLLDEIPDSNTLYRVLKFNGQYWEKVGNDINSNNASTDISIKISPNGTPFISYGHIVRTLVNNNWQQVASLPGDTEAWAIDQEGTIYDAGNNNMLPYVMKLAKNSTQWQYAGQFSTALPNEFYGANEFSIAISSKDIPYLSFVGFDDTLKKFAAFAMKLDTHSNQWTSIANTNITPTAPQNLLLTLDSDNNPYLYDGGNKPTIYTLSH